MNGIVRTPQAGASSVENGEQPAAAISHLRFEDIAELERLLRVARFDVTQTGRGALHGEATYLQVGDVRLVREKHHPAMVWTTAFDPELMVFVLPISWQGELAYNGTPVNRSHLFRFTDSSGYFGRNAAGGREVISVGIARQHLRKNLAALRGVAIDEVEIGNGALNLAGNATEMLRVLLAGIVADVAAHPEIMGDASYAARTSDIIETALFDCFLGAASAGETESRRAVCPSAIVRRAEEFFMRESDRKVTLAELCTAAGVSAPTLYKAFDAVCDITPLRYFRLRRLSLARSVLRKSPPDRGKVKYAALGVGLTELGRFAAEYRAMFGETPSTTLRGAGHLTSAEAPESPWLHADEGAIPRETAPTI